jgi:hypothetical protein
VGGVALAHVEKGYLDHGRGRPSFHRQPARRQHQDEYNETEEPGAPAPGPRPPHHPG